jgi:hypothetical protein
MADEQPPSTTTGNVFSLMAYVLFQVRHALEDFEEAGRPPRWVRVARAAPEKQEFLGNIVSLAVNGIAETTSLLADLTLEIEELLYQTDAAKAIGEVMLRMIQAMTDQTFQDGVRNLAGEGTLTNVKGAMDTINNAATQAEKYLKYIPEPEDVHGMGHELYRLLCIVQRAMPRTADNAIDTANPELTGIDHLVQNESGKVRLMAWAYGHGIETHSIGASETGKKELFKLGSRRLFNTANASGLAAQSKMIWSRDEIKVTIFQLTYGAGGTDDLKELVELLQLHGYNSPAMPAQPTSLSPDIRENLMKFQAINELPITGELDSHTLNRLLHLDFARKNLRRARPYDASFVWPWDIVPARQISSTLPVVNPGGDAPADEGITQIQGSPLRYYEVPTRPASASNWPRGTGWIRDSAGPIGFMVVESRRRNRDDKNVPGRFLGAKWSEGESAHGQYFYAARLSEPWVDGRFGPAGPGNLAPTPPAARSISRMYQWIPLPSWLQPPSNTQTWTLWVYASALQRSLFTNRDQEGYPDQGRIILERYESDGYNLGTVTVRVPTNSKDARATQWFPDLTATTAALTLDQVDRNRLWLLRKTEPMQVPQGTVALCLVAEGEHRSGLDTDAYFDDFQVHYYWTRAS